MARPYTHVQAVEKEMLEMKAAGKTNREIAEYFGFQDKYVVKRWVKRYNWRMRKMEAGIMPPPGKAAKGIRANGARKGE